jgi:hypothetical protein
VDWAALVGRRVVVEREARSAALVLAAAALAA